MPVYLLNEEIKFPPADESGSEGLLAIGGDLKPERLLDAYSNGIFPWYSDCDPIMWWSPDPRMLLLPDKFKVRKSLRNIINRQKFTVKFDHNFQEVIKQCAAVSRNDQDGTWITQEMIQAYTHLFEMGFAHSVEAYCNDKLVGGLYGISLGRAFFGESMFHKERDASKVALFYLVELLKSWDFHFIDAQQETTHLKSLGAAAVPRKKFLLLLHDALQYPTRKGKWRNIDE